MKRTLIILTTFFLSICFQTKAQEKSQLCAAARLHYTESEAAELSDCDIEKINYYYTSTYRVDSSHPYYSDFMKKYCKNGMMDVTVFERYRKEDTESRFGDEEFPGFYVYLTSWKEIREKYKQIETSKK